MTFLVYLIIWSLLGTITSAYLAKKWSFDFSKDDELYFAVILLGIFWPVGWLIQLGKVFYNRIE